MHEALVSHIALWNQSYKYTWLSTYGTVDQSVLGRPNVVLVILRTGTKEYESKCLHILLFFIVIFFFLRYTGRIPIFDQYLLVRYIIDILTL